MVAVRLGEDFPIDPEALSTIILALGLGTGVQRAVEPDLPGAGWGELLSVPSALGALRAALPPETFDPGRLARAAFVLAAVAALSFAVVLAEVTALDRAANRDDDPEVRG